MIGDIVLNHKHGGDEEENINVIAVNPKIRNEYISEPTNVTAYTKFTFPGRVEKYSSFKWNSTYFTGIDKNVDGEKIIYKILNEYGYEWEQVIGEELGSYDYLMGADVEFRNIQVRVDKMVQVVY